MKPTRPVHVLRALSFARWGIDGAREVAHTQRILRTLATHLKSLSLVTRAAFIVWAREAAKQSP